MNLIHWILNLAALFLWIDWRTGRATAQPQPVISLASALRETHRAPRAWGSLIAVLLILLVRPFFYHTVGASLDWTPVTDVLAISIPWRSDLLGRMFVYSTVGFGVTLVYYYGCILFVSAANAGSPKTEVLRRFIRAQLGWLDHLPWFLKLLAPFVAVAVSWAALVPILVQLGMLPATPPPAVLWSQAGILAVAALLVWKWFFVVLFLLHALNTYVYLGTHPVWPFIESVGAKLLKPLFFLRAGKLDLAPFAAIALILVLTEWLVRPWVFNLFERTLNISH